MKKSPIMAHLVLGYPTLEASIATAEQYIQSGCSILELQIPFSHPTADGPVITKACREAVENNGVTVEDCLHLLSTLRRLHPHQEIMVMTYLNRLFTFGIPQFANALRASNIRHIIVPDLPVDCPLAESIQKEGIQLVPVIAANIQPERLERLLSMPFDFYYFMSDFKITGSDFSLHPRLESILKHIKHNFPHIRTGIGFGISTPEQVKLVSAAADFAIIGSSLIKAQMIGELAAYLESLQV